MDAKQTRVVINESAADHALNRVQHKQVGKLIVQLIKLLFNKIVKKIAIT